MIEGYSKCDNTDDVANITENLLASLSSFRKKANHGVGKGNSTVYSFIIENSSRYKNMRVFYFKWVAETTIFDEINISMEDFIKKQ